MSSVRAELEALSKRECCHHHSHMGTDFVPACWSEDGMSKSVWHEGDCDECSRYKSRYLSFPLQVEDIEREVSLLPKALGQPYGTLVRVRPCAEEYEGKTYLGILVGRLPTQVCISYSHESKVLEVGPGMYNPLILIPETHSLVWGYESWWAELGEGEDVRDVTDSEIRASLPMQLLEALEPRGGEGGDASDS